MNEHSIRNRLYRFDSESNSKGHTSKRILLLFALCIQILSYAFLTQLRYEGQGLTPIYFRVTTLSDVFSISFFLLNLSLLVLTILRPIRLRKGAVITVTILSGILVWLYLGIRHTSSDDFTPEAAVVLLLVMFLMLAMLLTSSRDVIASFRRLIQVLRNTLAIALFFVLLAFVYSFLLPTYSHISDVTAFHADAGVIFGAAVWHGNGLGERPSPALRERIDLGQELLANHAVPRLIVTGGNAPGKLAEADVARRELLRSGIEPAQIIEETSSHSTLEQVLFLRDELFQKHGWSRFVIVSDQYHLARVCDMCKFNGLTAIGSPSHIHEPLLDLAYYRLRESVAMLEYWFLGR
jgi:vancomycin permeability regulator SanA